MPALYGIYLGSVVDVEDPEKANRVRVKIPGLCEPYTAWARPKGNFGYGLNLGYFGVPPLNSDVLVQFEAGNIDSPWYEPAAPKPGEVPEEVRGSYDKYMISFGGARILSEINEDGSSKMSIYLEDKESGPQVVIDGADSSVKIHAVSQVVIDAVGLVDISGTVVKIQGRLVAPGGKPI